MVKETICQNESKCPDCELAQPETEQLKIDQDDGGKVVLTAVFTGNLEKGAIRLASVATFKDDQDVLNGENGRCERQ